MHMKKEILENLRRKKLFGLATIAVIAAGFLVYHVTPTLALEFVSRERSIDQDGGGFEYTFDRELRDLPEEFTTTNDTNTTPPADETVTVTSQYVTNGSSAAGYRTYQVQVIDTLWYAWNRGTGTLFPSSDSTIKGWVAGLTDPNVTIGYDFGVFDESGTSRIPEGSTIPQGSSVVMKFAPYVSDNIFWFGTGYSMDSPYGEWRAGAAATPRVGNKVICDPKDLTEQYTLSSYDGYSISDDVYDVYIPLVMNPPQRTLANLNGFTCGALTQNGDGSMTATCTATGSGDVSPRFDYASTYGKFYYRYYDYRDMTSIGWGGPGCYGNNIPMSDYFGNATGPTTNGDTAIRSAYFLNIPNQNFAYPLTIGAAGNNPPMPPVLTCPSTVQTGVDISVSMNSTDADGDQVRYAIGWFSSSSPDSGWTALVDSGTNGSLTKTGGYGTAGLRTVYAWAEDANGARSTSSSCDIDVTAPPSAPVIGIESNVDSGAWSNSDKTIEIGDEVKIRWSITSGVADSCVTDFGASTAIDTTPDGIDVTEPAPGTSEQYNVTCTGPGGSDTKWVTVYTNGQPNLAARIGNTIQKSDVLNAAGEYTFVRFNLGVENVGTANAGASEYRLIFEIDPEGDGSYVTLSDTVTSIGAVSAASTVSIPNVTVSDVPAGNYRITMTADVNDAVVESDDSIAFGSPGNNNQAEESGVITPLEPGLIIEAERELIRPGESTTISWDVTTPYAGMSCTVTGTGVNESFDPNSSPEGDASTGVLSGKAEYTLSCTLGGYTFTESVIVEILGEIEEI